MKLNHSRENWFRLLATLPTARKSLSGRLQALVIWIFYERSKTHKIAIYMRAQKEEKASFDKKKAPRRELPTKAANGGKVSRSSKKQNCLCVCVRVW